MYEHLEDEHVRDNQPLKNQRVSLVFEGLHDLEIRRELQNS